MRHVRKDFLPDDDQSEFEVKVRAPEGTSLEATLRDPASASPARSASPSGVQYTLTSVADNDQRIANDGHGLRRAWSPLRQRQFDQFEMMNYVREEILPPYRKQDLRISVSPAAVFSGGGMSQADVQFMIGGPDLDKLGPVRAASDAATSADVPGAVDVDSSLVVGKPEYGVHDRSRQGRRPGRAGRRRRQHAAAAGGRRQGQRLRRERRGVRGPRRGPRRVPHRLDGAGDGLGALVAARHRRRWPTWCASSQATGPSAINRLNRKRQVTISANMTPGTSQQSDPRRHRAQRATSCNMRPGYTHRPAGQIEGDGRARSAASCIVFVSAIHLHVPGARGAVRVVAAPHHHPALAAADAALRA